MGTFAAQPVPLTTSGEVSDSDLVARVRAGDDRAFERLYSRYHRRIAAYVQGMVHDHARAEDITQDVFMSALRRIRETDRTIAFKPWVYEIAKNACIDQFRRSRRAEEVSYDAEDGGLGAADYGRLVGGAPTPEVAVDQKQQIDHLRGAFGGLSETHHEILVMRELEGLSYREIGDRLGMTRPAVESTLFRARRRLTEEYEELVSGERCARIQTIISGATAGALGTRDRRRMARHVSYCQPCRRQAVLAGLDASMLVHKPVKAKIAAFLPLPAFLKRRWGGSDDGGAVSNAAGHHGSTIAQWSAQLGAFDPGLVSGWGKAAATAATIAIAGVTAGAATDSSGGVTDTGPAAALLQSLRGDGDGGSSSDRVARGADGGARERAAGAATGDAARGARRGTTTTAGSGGTTADAPGGGAGTGSGTKPASKPDGGAHGGGVGALLGGEQAPDPGDDTPGAQPPTLGIPTDVPATPVDPATKDTVDGVTGAAGEVGSKAGEATESLGGKLAGE
jgi:RNA polymerase sigma factor (sigma-70 family)